MIELKKRVHNLPYSTQAESIVQEMPGRSTNKEDIIFQYIPMRKYRMQTEIGNAHELRQHPHLAASLLRTFWREKKEIHHSFLLNFFNRHREKFTQSEQNEITYWMLKIMKIESIKRNKALAIALFSVKHMDSTKIQTLVPRIGIRWIKLFAQKYGLFTQEYQSKWVSDLNLFIHQLPPSPINIHSFISNHIHQTYLLKYHLSLRLTLLLAALFPEIPKKELFLFTGVSRSNYYMALKPFRTSTYYRYLQKLITQETKHHANST